MLTDYKFWYIRRDDNGYITEAAIRFYEGDITTEDEYCGVHRKLQSVTRYRRTKQLSKEEVAHLDRKKFVVDNVGKHCPLYTPVDFGRIKSDEELEVYLDEQLKKDTKRNKIKCKDNTTWQL